MPGTEQEWDQLKQYGGPVFATDTEQKDWARILPRFDEVARPEHYNSGGVECIEAIKASMSAEEYRGYLKGNTLKYLWRYSYKGKPKQDLEKAKWYLERLIGEIS